MTRNYLLKLSNKKDVGVYSVCSANEIVIEASLEYARDNDAIAVIESTANQVDQFGGYTGMTPSDFRDYVYEIADKVKIDKSKIVLGGDHLGPLTWTHLEESTAMENAKKLVYEYVRAGFTKIHLDTSMKIKGDPKSERLSDEVIAERSAILAQQALLAYDELLKEKPDSVFPIFVIGSEVPIPGGAQEVEESITVTSVEDFEQTYKTFKDTFEEYDVSKVFDNVVGIVVQPGVEFGDAEIHHYSREKAKTLTSALKDNYKTLVFEGHSTDYQTPENLKMMVEDGICILKVGPALTFALREALFSLSYIDDIVSNNPAKFIETLEEVMLNDSNNWKNHYHGDGQELFIKRKFSFSDRARYYLPQEEVEESLNKLISNLSNEEINLSLLSQYMPNQFQKVNAGVLENNPYVLIKDYIKSYLEPYELATKSSSL